MEIDKSINLESFHKEKNSNFNHSLEMILNDLAEKTKKIKLKTRIMVKALGSENKPKGMDLFDEIENDFDFVEFEIELSKQINYIQGTEILNYEATYGD